MDNEAMRKSDGARRFCHRIYLVEFPCSDCITNDAKFLINWGSLSVSSSDSCLLFMAKCRFHFFSWNSKFMKSAAIIWKCHIYLARKSHNHIYPNWSFYMAKDAPIMISRDNNINFKCLPTVFVEFISLRCIHKVILIKLGALLGKKGHAFKNQCGSNFLNPIWLRHSKLPRREYVLQRDD